MKEDHNRANDEASPKPASSSSEPIGYAVGSGIVFVAQFEAKEKEIAGLFFADMPFTFGVVFTVVVVMAESMCTNCGLDRGVDTSESEYLLLVFFL